MSNIDNYYRSAMTYTQSPPTTDTFNSSFNYSTAENLYGSNVLLYTGLIPSTNPLVSAGDGDTYSSGGIEIVEKIDGQVLTAIQESSFGFTDDRLTYLIPGSVYGITVWSKDAVGDYTVVVPPQYYDLFFYPSTGTYVVYFKDTSYEPMYRTLDGLIALQYPPAITCYRYCGPKGIENIPAGGGPQGATGAQGSNGANGPQGSAGSNGPQGAQGPTGAGSSGPSPVVVDAYFYDDNATTTFKTFTPSLVTGLEPNYLYKVSLNTQVIFNYSGSALYKPNFKIRFRTQGGNSSVTISDFNSFWMNAKGGYYPNWQEDKFFGVTDYVFESGGWGFSPATAENWSDIGLLKLDFFYVTGSTSDQSSFRMDFALNAADVGSSARIQFYELLLVMEPIRQLFPA